MKPIYRNNATRRSFAGLALACVLALQFVTLGHDAQHAVGDLDESCQVCLQQNGNAPLAYDVDLSIEVPTSSAPLIGSGVAPVLQPVRQTKARAPPSI